MSIELFGKVICVDIETKQVLDHHSILVGKKCAYCMNCGKILIEYKNVKDFKRLMNPFENSDEL